MTPEAIRGVLLPGRLGVMHFRPFGATGITVSELCLGTAMFGARGNPDHDDVVRMIHRALDAGINFVDTADIYGMGEAETIVGKALAGSRRDSVILMSKFFAPMSSDPNSGGSSRRWIMRAVEGSLRRLGTEWLDVYQIHRPDPGCAIEETLSAVADLVHAGKVRYLGSSSFPAERIVEAQWAAARRRVPRVVCEEAPYSLFSRGVEASVLPVCRRHELAFIGFSPLNAGWLTGKYRRDSPPPADSRADRFQARAGDEGYSYWTPFFAPGPANDHKLALVEVLEDIARTAGLTLAHLAQAWVLEHPGVTASIIGPRTREQLEATLAGVDVVLDADVLDAVDAEIPPGTDLDAFKMSWQSDALQVESRRRRPR